MKSKLKNIWYLALFTACPLLMIGGILILLYSYPEKNIPGYVMIVIGIFLMAGNKNIVKAFNSNKQEMEYDEFGLRKGMESYSTLSKRERIEVDKQKLANMERIVSSTALKRMTKPGASNPEQEMEKLIGLAPVKVKMRTMAARMEYDFELYKKSSKGRMNKKNNLSANDGTSRHMIFVGSPGTGKTTVARIMTGFLYQYGFISENKCLETDGNFLKAGTQADTAAKTELIIRQALGGVLFIDEAYALIGDSAGEAAIATLIKRMEDDRGKFVLILAGYVNEMKLLINSNPGLASRFKEYIEFPDYTDLELEEIFQIMVNRKGLCVTAGAIEQFRERIKIEKKISSFGNARTVRNITEECVDLHALHLKEGTVKADEHFRLTASDVPDTISQNSFWK